MEKRGEAMTADIAFFEIGKIVSPQGLKGEVKVYPMSDFPERFQEPGPRWLLRPNSQTPEPIELERGRCLDGKGLYVIKLVGVDDRDGAEALRDCKLLIPQADRPHLAEGEFHVPDLLGLEVFDQASQVLIGTVKTVIPAGNDLLEIVRPDGKTVLVPFVEPIVPIVDLNQGRIEIVPPKGLLEL